MSQVLRLGSVQRWSRMIVVLNSVRDGLIASSLNEKSQQNLGTIMCRAKYTHSSLIAYSWSPSGFINQKK